VFIGGIANKLPFQLVVKPSITSASDLKGKRIAISRFGSSTETAARIAVQSLGLKPTDVFLLQVGGEGTRTAAMQSGQIDGSMEQDPRSGELEQQGYHVMVDCAAVVSDYPNTAYVTTRRYLAAHPDRAKNFLAAIAEAIYDVRTHPQQAMEVAAAFLKAPQGPPLVTAYQRFTKEVYPYPPYPSEPGVTAVLAGLTVRLPKAANVKASDLIDTSALDSLKESGFFDRLEAPGAQSAADATHG
jgi:NitT/TauT family transport system substrate-binding protein